MTDEDAGIATDAEALKLAAEQFEAMAKSAAGNETSGLVDVDPETILAAADEPDFAYINTYRVDAAGRMMRVKVLFHNIDDPTIGFAYMRAITNKDSTRESRKRLERKLWKVYVKGPDIILTEAFYEKFKPQARAELTNHCLARSGAISRKFAGIDQVAYVPAGNLVMVKPDAPPEHKTPAAPAAPPTPATSPASPSGSSGTPTGISTASDTSSTSPAGSEKGPSSFSVSGPPKKSKRRGLPATGSP